MLVRNLTETTPSLLSNLDEKSYRRNELQSLEQQLQSALDRGATGELSRADIDGIISRDLEHIHSQLVQKVILIHTVINDFFFLKRF